MVAMVFKIPAAAALAATAVPVLVDLVS